MSDVISKTLIATSLSVSFQAVVCMGRSGEVLEAAEETGDHAKANLLISQMMGHDMDGIKVE